MKKKPPKKKEGKKPEHPKCKGCPVKPEHCFVPEDEVERCRALGESLGKLK